MGTNYYLQKRAAAPCVTCGHQAKHEELHVGKSSAGWVFSLRIHPDEGIHGLEDWKARFLDGVIEDEYGKAVSAEEMVANITKRSWPHDPDMPPHGYISWREMLRLNRARITPEGLLASVARPGSPYATRDPEDGGTYQLCDYEFS